MDHVLTLIANPQRPAVDADTIVAVRKALAAAGATPGEPAVLARDIALDLPFAAIAPEAAMKVARQALGERPIDAIAQPAAARRKKLLVADMESTIIENEMLDELADFFGLRDQIAAITARAMNGEIDFAAALRERIFLLKGLKTSLLDEAATRIRYMPGAAALIATMRANGACCALVSGGFTHFTAIVRRKLGFDIDRANQLLTEGDTLAGAVAEPILGKEAKLAALLELAVARALRPEQTLAVGDGANDLPMLQAAGLGIAFHAKPTVAAAVAANIRHGDLTALLYAQGYKRDEFVD
ncbi:phosphoserine phosphatase SerB [Vineibacter terrae]|uniref:phosphoserine phosphatase SerB n=1 Tax=Vineibacter terrae TaxID=2586908 RepID=UPI002E2ED862|nr:phosphoserine phosphatase SerB [Vineibacter terrae]HEX2889034.1 phosphoserine phosphatase SerB [Vineibacter terrae]